MNNKKENYSFNFAVGKGVIGWSIYSVDKNGFPIQINKAGVRVFSDGTNPKTGETLNSNRRAHRISRRKHDRRLKRKKTLLKFLIKSNFISNDELKLEYIKSLNVYELRTKAIRDRLELVELGRIFLHLNQRRGYQSYRATNLLERKNETLRAKKFENFLYKNKYLTIGSYLNQLQINKCPLRFRMPNSFLPSRTLYELEFDQIMTAQKEFHPNIDENTWQRIRQIIFFQRPINVQKNVPRCSIFHSELAAPAYSLDFQKILLLKSIDNLRVIDETQNSRELTQIEKINIFNKLILNLEDTDLESLGISLRENERVCLIGTLKRKIGIKQFHNKTMILLNDFLQSNPSFNVDILFELLTSNISTLNMEKALDELGIEKKIHEELLNVTPPSGFSPYSSKGLLLILKRIQNTSESLDTIIEQLKNLNSPTMDLSTLAYNSNVHPTLKNALTQLDNIIKKLIEEYELPKYIKFEVLEELKLSRNVRQEIKLKKHKQCLGKIRAKEILNKEYNFPCPEYAHVARYILWDELKCITDNELKTCPFTLQPIPFSKLFTDEIVVVNLLPFSRTLNDSLENKTICYRSAGIEKGNKTIWEAFHGNPGYDFDEILRNCSMFTFNKKKHFTRQPTVNFLESDQLIQLQMKDKSYESELVKKLVRNYCDNIIVVSSRIVPLIEYSLQFPILKSTDYMVYSLRAISVGLVSEEFLKSFILKNEIMLNNIKCREPYSNFLKNVSEILDSINVSRKENHKINRKLHDETFYGVIDHPDEYEKEHRFNLVVRKPIQEIKITDVQAIRAKNIRDSLGETISHGQFLKSLQNNGIRRLKVMKKDKTVLRLFHPEDSKKFYKGILPSEIHSVEVWKMPNGYNDSKTKMVSSMKFVTYNFLEKITNLEKKPHPAAKRILRIHKGDTLKILRNLKFELVCIRTIRPSKNLIGVVPLHLKSKLDEDTIWITFSAFEKMQIRRVKITGAGKILDSGTPY